MTNLTCSIGPTNLTRV